MEYEATVVLEQAALEPPSASGDDAENFVMQLVQGYLEGREPSADSIAAQRSATEQVTFEYLLRKPGWFSAG